MRRLWSIAVVVSALSSIAATEPATLHDDVPDAEVSEADLAEPSRLGPIPPRSRYPRFRAGEVVVLLRSASTSDPVARGATGTSGDPRRSELLARHGAKSMRRVFRTFEDAKGRLIDTAQARVDRVRGGRSARRGAAAARLEPADPVPALENYFVVEFPGTTKDDIARIVKELESDEDVLRAQPNYIYEILDAELPATSYIPDDPYVSQDGVFWSLGSFGNAYPDLYGVRNVSALEAFARMDTNGNGRFDEGETRPGEGVVIAVIDTGLDTNHPDIRANVFTNAGEVPDDGIDNDGNGFVDDVHGWDFIADDAEPQDGYGHGTHVAGTAAAAAGSRYGIVGVAPFASILPLKALDDDGRGGASGLAAAIEYAAATGADVISNSWGGFIEDDLIRAAFDVAAASGSLSVAAAGNDSQPRLSMPALFESVLSVAAIDHDNVLAWFSNSSTTLDLCAPGVSTLGPSANVHDNSLAVPRRQVGPDHIVLSGTSMATPHVAGAAATLMSMFPEESAAETHGRLLAGGVSIDLENPTQVGLLGAGRLDLLESALATPVPALRIVRIATTPLVAGQTATIEVEVKNFWAPARSVRATLSEKAGAKLRLLTREVDYGDLGAGERKTRSFEVRVRPSIRPGAAIELRIRMSDADGSARAYPLTLHADYFEDVSASAELEPSPIVAAGATFGDFDGDGLTDFAVSSLSTALEVYQNRGDGTYEPKTLRSVRDKRPLLVDLDGDGDRDLLAPGPNGSALFENDGAGAFTEKVGSGFDARVIADAITPIDLDADGDLDLVTTRHTFFKPADDEVYRSVNVLRNDGDLTFTNVWQDTGLPRGMAHLQVLSFDYDSDGLPDLFGVSRARDQGALYRNIGNGQFLDVTQNVFRGDFLGCMVRCERVQTAAIGDYDNDEDLDIVTVGDNLQRADSLVFHLFQNDGHGNYIDVTNEAGELSNVIAATGIWGAGFFDLENDGDLDLIAGFNGVLSGGSGRALATTNVVMRNDGDGTFKEISSSVFPYGTQLASYVTVIGDVDGDGGLDVFGAAGTTIIETGGLLRNIGARGNWLEVSLVSRISPPDGYGARVTLDTGRGKRQIREVHYSPVEPFLVHFGIGSKRRIRSVEVRWPSGIVQRLDSVSPNQHIVIEEPAE